ncbi:MAG: hypothetical protein QXD43_04870 [Candidatus Aenigmatarchaeota archaeon]|nr:hypothetical protein [Candidatus Bathyarchaeota archaeon]
MVKKIITRFIIAKKKGKKRGSFYKSPRIYLPTKLTDDSSFPFKEGDKILIRIQGKKLIIEKYHGTVKKKKD